MLESVPEGVSLWRSFFEQDSVVVRPFVCHTVLGSIQHPPTQRYRSGGSDELNSVQKSKITHFTTVQSVPLCSKLDPVVLLQLLQYFLLLCHFTTHCRCCIGCC
jgi:hypothetical protein